MHNGTMRELTDVRLKHINKNLLSIGALKTNGYREFIEVGVRKFIMEH